MSAPVWILFIRKLYLKLGKGWACAGHIKENSMDSLALKVEDSDLELNCGFAPPIGSKITYFEGGKVLHIVPKS